jgi:glycosyltransferase involved in cell wall biosynthesis
MTATRLVSLVTLCLALAPRPAYRAPFFELLAQSCEGGLHLISGNPLPIEAISTKDRLSFASHTYTRNRHLFHTRHPFYLFWQDSLKSRLEKIQPDALIVEANPRYLSTPSAIRWMKARGQPTLGWGLGAAPANTFFASQRARFLKTLDGIIAYSEKGAEEYRALNIFPPNRIFTAPNAVAPRPVSPPLLRSPIPSYPINILFVGRLQSRKRLDLLFQACAQLPQAIQPNLTIVGDGPDRESIESLAREHYPKTTFVGALHGPELAPHFATADLFVLPGTGGLAVQEAMSHALPVIVAEGDGTQDALVRSANGWLVPPGGLFGLRTVLEEALSSPARLREMGEESYRIVSEEINLEAMVQKFIQALNEVMHV